MAVADVAKLVIEIQTRDLKSAQQELKAFGVAANGAAASANRLTSITGKSSSALLRQASLLKTIGRDLSRYFTIPIVAAGTASLKMALDFNKAMGNVQALIPGTGNRIYELSEDVRNLGKETGVAFDDIAAGLYRTISVFQDGKDTVERLNTAVKAGVAGYATTEEAVALLSAVTRAYGDTSAAAVDKVANLAFEAIRLGDTTFPALAAAMQVATDRAVRLGVSQEDLFTVFATLTGITGDASMVATQFRSAMDSLLTPTDEMNELFKKLSVSSGEALIEQYGFVEAMKLINDEAIKMGISLQTLITRKEGITLVSRLATQQFSDFGDKLEQVTKNGTAFNDAYKSVTEGIAKSAIELEKMKNEIRDNAIEIGNSLIPLLAEVLDRFLLWIEYQKSLNGPLREFRDTLLTLAAIAGPVAILLGSVAKLATFIGNVALPLVSAFTVALTGMAAAAFAAAPIFTLLAITVAAVPLGQWISDMITSKRETDRFVKSAREFNKETAKMKEMPSIDLKALGITEAPITASVAVFGDIIRKLSTYDKKFAETEDKVKKRFGVADLPILARASTLEQLELGIKAYTKMSNDALDMVDSRLAKDKAIQRQLLDFDYKGVEGPLIKAMGPEVEIYDYLIMQLEGYKAKLKTLPEATGNVTTQMAKHWSEYYEEITGVERSRFAYTDKDTGEVVSYLGKQAAAQFSADLDLQATAKATVDSLLGRKTDLVEQAQDRLDALTTAYEEFVTTRDNTNTLLTTIEIDNVQYLVEDLEKLIVLAGKDYDDLLLRRTALEAFNQEMQTQNKLIQDQIELRKAEKQARIDSSEDFMMSMIAARTGTGQFTGRKSGLESLSDQLGVLKGRFTEISNGAKKYTQADLDELFSLIEEAQSKVDLAELKEGFKASVEEMVMSLATSGLITFFDSFGAALDRTNGSFEDLSKSMAQFGIEAIKTMGQLMMQVGLQMLLNPATLPVGLGLIAAGGGTLMLGGYLSSKANPSTSSQSVEAYASGGIVNGPTYFPNNGGIGLAGEAGPEAIMPLSRTASGNLGVETTGNVNVNVYNNTSSDVNVQQSSDGRSIDVIIDAKINQGFMSGRYDGTMSRLYGVKRQGAR